MMTYKVDSSAIKEIGYSPKSRVMSITFQSGGTYYYDEVPSWQFERLMRANSVGKYYHKNIKGKYMSRSGVRI